MSPEMLAGLEYDENVDIFFLGNGLIWIKLKIGGLISFDKKDAHERKIKY